MEDDLLVFRKEGIYCPAGDFYIDPTRRVARAVLTHAHSDHAKAGMGSYLCHHQSSEVLKLRLGKNIPVESLEYNKTIFINGIKLSFHPSGHLPGAAQVRVESGGQVWVVSGDYKTENDGLAKPFEPVPCHCFITESTFGLPIFRWQSQDIIFSQIEDWWQNNAAQNRPSIVFAYSLGKAQRIIHNLQGKGMIAVHETILKTNNALSRDGVLLPILPEIRKLPKTVLNKSLILSPTINGLPTGSNPQTANCSGWLAIRSYRGKDKGFVLSDHADWNGLLSAIESTGAQRVIAVHGYTSALVRYLSEKGLEAEIGIVPGSPNQTKTDSLTF